MAYYNQSASPPPLQHPVPTHPAYIPEPPSTPASPQGYQRYASSPQPPHSQPSGPGYPQPSTIPAGATMSRAPVPPAGSYSAYGVQGHMAQQQQQQSHGHIPAATPDFSAWGLNDATAQFGMQLGQNAVAAGQDYVQKNLGGWVPISAVKQHFNVSNSYVIKKLQVVVFPWRHKPWSRKVTRLENGQSEWAVPREDINSPDLYIPLMALVTYILLAALYSGLNSRFHPEILGVTASKALAVVLLDFLFVKGGCYFLNIQGTTQVLDLIAYDGYKFVGVIVTIIAGMLNFGRTLYSLVFLYSFFATAFFLLRSLRSLILPDAAATAAPVNTSHRSRRITFLFLVAVSQIVYMGLLVRV